MLLLLRTFVSVVSSLSHLLLWLLGHVRTVLFFRMRSSKPLHYSIPAASSAGLEWRQILVGVVLLLLLPRACRAASSCLRRTDLRLWWGYLKRAVRSSTLIPWRRADDDGRAQHPRLPQNLPRRFSFRELKDATDGFSDGNKLGSGSFGAVYKGRHGNGDVIAVKRLINLSVGSTQDEQWQFENEARLLQLRHGNIVQLLGHCCEKRHRLLCYEYMAKGSLDKYLFGKRPTLGWGARHRIIKGICCGLRYLHEECEVEKQMLHLDIKPSNILLDNAMNPKISDFGLSRLFDRGSTYTFSSFFAPMGYSPPEYFYRGIVSAKTDIFGFGVLLLEIATNEKDCLYELTSQNDPFIEYANRLVSRRAPPPDYVKDDCFPQFRNCIKIGLMCVSVDENRRPSAGEVMDRLNAS